MKKGFMNVDIFLTANRYHDSDNGNIKFDESGQVFTEVSCPGGPMTLDLDWLRKTQGSSREAARSRSLGLGCSPLVDIAIRSNLGHSSKISAESLEGVPWEVAGLLWERLISS